MGAQAGRALHVHVCTGKRSRLVPCEVDISSPHRCISLRIIVAGVQWCAGVSHRMNSEGG